MQKIKKVRMLNQDLFCVTSSNLQMFNHCAYTDPNNKNLIWLSSNHFSYPRVFDTEEEEFNEIELLKFEFKNNFVYCMYIDSNNYLWIGSDHRFFHRYDFNRNLITKFKLYTNELEKESQETLGIIREDKMGNLYLGTTNRGFYKLDQDRINRKRFTKKEGLPCDEVSSILIDKNQDLWISTNKGISKFNTLDLKFHNFSEADGINGDEFISRSDFKSEDGTMYFGGNKGITYFKPEEITTNPYIPKIAITDFQIFYESIKPSPENPFLKKSISYAKEITLTYKESVITFEFAALIFNNPKKNEYAYKMEGFDEDWVYCGTRRTATYTNLDPGEYTFRVKGSNNDGLWNEEGTSIKVTITPPWYKTVLFKGLVGLSVIGSIGSFYRNRIQKLSKEKTQQEEFTKKLIESQENERKRVAAELHDSLGQDLLIIKNKALVSIKKNEPEKLLEQMNEISELTSATLNDVREISYNLRPYELDRLGLSKTIESMIERANNSTNINFTASLDNIDKVFIPEVEINIYRIIQESLNNVIKHSEAKEVIVSVLKRGKEIRINISDDGKGFDIKKYRMNSKRAGFGLKGIEERVKLMDGEFEVRSEIGKGTEVEIQLAVNS